MDLLNYVRVELVHACKVLIRMDALKRMEEQAEFEAHKDRLEQLAEKRKELQSARDCIDKSESSKIWMSTRNSSFFLLDSHTEAKSKLDRLLSEVEDELRDVCAKVQQGMDKMAKGTPENAKSG